MSGDNRPRVVVSSDGGGNRGMLIAVVVLAIVIVAAIWAFNQSDAGDATNVNVDIPAGEADPGTETTIAP
ncbi:MAG TPA: hypothetical protein VJQ79_15020 [Acidimicrobiia bacterium]|nr:hypothetical protein [Acidimicrobiia bacterium]